MFLPSPRRVVQLKHLQRKEEPWKWTAWYQRQQAALRTILPLNEPPPCGFEDDIENELS